MNRWQQTFQQDIAVSTELCEVLQSTARWAERTSLAFHPASEALTRLWAVHEKQNKPVSIQSLLDVREQLQQPLWETDCQKGTARRLTHLPVTLNSIIKGTIIDRAAQEATGCESVLETLVNTGSDLRHISTKPTTIEITDVFATADNAPPVAAVQIYNQGLATSGNYRRGFRIGKQWFSHVLDRPAGARVEHSARVSVIAADSQTVAVLATAFNNVCPFLSCLGHQ